LTVNSLSKELVMNSSTTSHHRSRPWAALLLSLVVALAAVGFLRPRPALAAPPAVAAIVDQPTDDPPTTTGKASAGRLNLNTATVDQLMLLSGVGPAKAERIVAFRTAHGPFKRVADLRRVKGFGYKTLKKLERFLDVKGDTTLTVEARP
jgi:competence ComEA-like helix-hairpin-helix protein